MLNDPDSTLVFSAVNLWEISIKRSLGRASFQVDPRILRHRALSHGYEELNIVSEHAIFLDTLPMLHRDPFDRLLIAQATFEGMTLLTADKTVAQYSGPIRLV